MVFTYICSCKCSRENLDFIGIISHSVILFVDFFSFIVYEINVIVLFLIVLF